MKRCIAIFINGIDIGMSIKEELDALMTTMQRCAVKRSIAIFINGIDIGMSIKEELDALMITFR